MTIQPQHLPTSPRPAGLPRASTRKRSTRRGSRASWACHRSDPKVTHPDTLVAAAHSACFAMALAAHAAAWGLSPDRLSLATTIILGELDGMGCVVAATLAVRGRGTGLDAASFRSLVAQAAESCQVRQLFAGIQLTVTAKLDTATSGR